MKALLLLMALSSAAFGMKIKDSKVILEELEDYNFCQSKDYDGSSCNEALRSWVKNRPKDAFEAGKLARSHMHAWVAVPFFAEALAQTNFKCGDEDLKLAVVSGLNLPQSLHPQIVDSAIILLKKCPLELKGPVAASANIGSYAFANACENLSLKGLKRSKCETLKKENKN
jgi:hypothetical protein